MNQQLAMDDLCTMSGVCNQEYDEAVNVAPVTCSPALDEWVSEVARMRQSANLDAEQRQGEFDRDLLAEPTPAFAASQS